MGGPTANITVDGRAGLNNNDLVMVGASDGNQALHADAADRSPRCQRIQLGAHPCAGTGNYNPADPVAAVAASGHLPGT